MNLRTLLRPLALAAPLLGLLPAMASAQQAYISAPTELFAGPGSNYPAMLTLVPGTEVWVEGCLPDYWWCDVRLQGGWRGWVFGRRLAYAWMGETLPVPQYGPSFGVPIVTFLIGDYWGRYYRDRPWYQERRYWVAPPQPYGGPPPRDEGWRSAYPQREREHEWDERERRHWRGAEREQPFREERQNAYPPRGERPAQPLPGSEFPQRGQRDPHGGEAAGYPPERGSEGPPRERVPQAQPGMPRPPELAPRPAPPTIRPPVEANPAPALQAPPRAPQMPPPLEREPNRGNPPPHLERPVQGPPPAPRLEAPPAPAPRMAPPAAPRPPEGPHGPHRDEH